MDLVYYWYYHGEDEFEEKMNSIFTNKDYDAFLKVYEVEADIRLPKEAVLYIGERSYINVPISNKDVFMNLTNIEYDWG